MNKFRALFFSGFTSLLSISCGGGRHFAQGLHDQQSTAINEVNREAFRREESIRHDVVELSARVRFLEIQVERLSIERARPFRQQLDNAPLLDQ